MSNNSNSLTAGEVTLVISLIAFVLFLSLGFQTVQILRDRDSLHQFMSQQDKPLEDSRKVQAQVSALALGTKKLADGGDKNAAAIIERMQKLGITVGGPAPEGAAPAAAAPAPAAPAAPAAP